MKTQVFFDCETGGLNPAVHGITSVAAIAFEIDGHGQAHEVDRLALKVKPNPELAYTPFALNLQNETLESLEQHGIPENAVLCQLVEFLIRTLGQPGEWGGRIWAHNAPFDHGFIQALDARYEPKGLFKGRIDWSCTKGLFYVLKALGVHDGKWSNLKSVAEQFGVVQGTAHDALEDAVTGMHCMAAMTRAWKEHE
jgi:DNA polymerase III epsilon subunit-like protein